MSDPSDPHLVGEVESSGLAAGVAVQGQTAILADYDDGVLVIDISDPTRPRPVCTFQTPDLSIDVAVSGSAAFVAARKGGLVILDRWAGAIFSDGFESGDPLLWSSTVSR